MHLVDTNVLFAGAPARAAHSPDLAAWMEGNSDRLYLSAVTVTEVEDGVAKARRERAIRKADRLAAWLQTLLHLYGARILPIDLPAARLLGSLSDQARAAGRAPGLADLAIAATAAGRGYVVLTRNPRDFDGLGVLAHDPFASLPP